MRKTIWNCVTVISLVLLILLQTGIGEAGMPTQTLDRFVNDFAEIFSAEQKEEILRKSKEMADRKEGIQLVVTTVVSLRDYGRTGSIDKRTYEEYAKNMYNSYIGSNEMSLLILIGTGDRKIWVAPGREIRKLIRDSRMDALVNEYAMPKLKENQFAEGIVSLYGALLNEVERVVYSEVQGMQTVTDVAVKEKEESFPWQFVVLGISIVAIVIALIPRKPNRKKWKEEDVASYIEPGFRRRSYPTSRSSLTTEERIRRRASNDLHRSDEMLGSSLYIHSYHRRTVDDSSCQSSSNDYSLPIDFSGGGDSGGCGGGGAGGDF
jgi:uncharacterized membrane protein YgcG